MIYKRIEMIIVLLISSSIIQIGLGDSCFLFTCSGVLRRNEVEIMYLKFFEVDIDCTVTITLLYNNDTEITQSQITAKSDVTTEIKYDVPDVGEYNGKIKIEGSCGEYDFQGIKPINFRSPSDVVFIQTDKPIYQAGQTVKIRILVLTENLRPSDKKINAVWIENPQEIRTNQWLDVTYCKGFGIIQLEMSLSEEPDYGVWKINVDVNNDVSQQYFTVEEYVLPKFQVVIIPPSFLLSNFQEFSFRTCANYTYGQPVKGTLEILVYYDIYSWDKVFPPKIKERVEINGCYDYSVSADSLESNNTNFNYRYIKIFVEVEEAGTGVEINATTSIGRQSYPLRFTFNENNLENSYFKPGLLYKGTLKITTPDQKAVSGSKVQICLVITYKVYTDEWIASKESASCKNFTSDKNGLINFTIPSQNHYAVSINIKAESLDYTDSSFNGIQIYQPRAEIIIKSWYSKNESYIQIQKSSDYLQCGKSNINVWYRKSNANLSPTKFKYQITSRGQIISQGEIEHVYNPITPVIDCSWISKKVCSPPNYFIPNNTVQNNIEDFKPLERLLRVNRKQTSYSKLKLSIDVTPEMAYFMRIVIYFVEDGEIIADSATFIVSDCLSHKVKLEYKETKVYPGSNATLNIQADPSSVCGITAVDKSVYLLKASNQLSLENIMNYLKALDGYGKIYSNGYKYCSKLDSDCNDGPIEKTHITESVDSSYAFKEAGIVAITDCKMEIRPCVYSPDSYCPFYGDLLDFGISDLAGGGSKPGLGKVSESDDSIEPTKSYRDFFPESWLWLCEETNENGVFTSEYETPDTITEWYTDAICISKTSGLGIAPSASLITFQPFFISFTLPYSAIRGEIIPVIVTAFNYLSECLNLQLILSESDSFKIAQNSSSYFFCVCGGESVTRNFSIIPNTIDTINITVTGQTVTEPRSCSNQTTSDLEYQDIVVQQLLVEAEGFPKENTTTTFLCPDKELTRSFNIIVPSNVVVGSERAIISITGDVMSQSIKNMDQLVILPTGCGEQSLVLFGSNVAILDYMIQTGTGSEELQNKALANCVIGYQRELTYRRSDCSYSSFGEKDDDGSMFLTAFVVKIFSRAENFIYIDKTDLKCSIEWIIKEQQKSNGCINNRGEIFQKALQGGLNEESNSEPLTAYVLIALLEAKYNNQTVIEQFLSCIKHAENPSIYTLSLITYATTLAKDPSASDYLKQLMDMSVIKDDKQYWKQNDETQSNSVNIEISSYAILSILQGDDPEKLSKVFPIVKGLISQQSYFGGFYSTQDTVVGIQALAAYGKEVNENELNMIVNISTKEINQTYHITTENKLLLQQIRITDIPTVVDITAEGSGCSILQISLRYNIQTDSDTKAFELTLSAKREQGNCKKASIDFCVRYVPNNQSANMAIVEIKMISGFEPVDESLQKLIGDSIKRREFHNGKVFLYFGTGKISNENQCFQFYILEGMSIENRKPSTAFVQDYYALEKYDSLTYEIAGNCN